jgi:hypothetical protein
MFTISLLFKGKNIDDELNFWIKYCFFTQCIMKIKLGLSSPKVTDQTVEKSRENSLIFLLNLNNSLDFHKIN